MMNSSDTVLSARNLGKAFGKVEALNGCDIDIHKGELTALLGRNGAGKTTFIRCALGLTKHSTGTLRVLDGHPGTLAIRRRIGAMLQASDLPDLLTPREHIALFSSYYPNPVPMEELIELCQLTDFADKKYKALSGGQKRRAQFALAIIGRPDLVFLDEPTTGLDTDARRGLWQTVRALCEAGTSVLLTTHYLEEADALADRIILMRAGQVITDGSADTIRRTVSGAIIRCVTDLSDDRLSGLPDVEEIRRAGRYVELITQSAPATLKALLQQDQNLSDLTVSKPDLEDAVMDLSRLPQQSE